MTTNTIFSLVIGAAVFCACGENPAPDNASVDTGYHETPLVTDTQPDSLLYMDTSVMVVDSTSHISFNGQAVPAEPNSIYNAVYNTWMQAYQRTGHLSLRFALQQQGTVTMGIRGNIGDAVMKAQEDVKNYIAKDTYQSSFSELPAAVKDSLAKVHPVLFTRPF